uniref:8TM_micro domain-containing protein n=1 Tax=Heterorhabditis bacteriophora TaxID=37862 RepID=A0A1I7WIB8_HETBA
MYAKSNKLYCQFFRLVLYIFKIGVLKYYIVILSHHLYRILQSYIIFNMFFCVTSKVVYCEYKQLNKYFKKLPVGTSHPITKSQGTFNFKNVIFTITYILHILLLYTDIIFKLFNTVIINETHFEHNIFIRINDYSVNTSQKILSFIKNCFESSLFFILCSIKFCFAEDHIMYYPHFLCFINILYMKIGLLFFNAKFSPSLSYSVSMYLILLCIYSYSRQKTQNVESRLSLDLFDYRIVFSTCNCLDYVMKKKPLLYLIFWQSIYFYTNYRD